MSIIDRIRELFGGKQSGAEQTAATGGTVAATSGADRTDETAPQSDSGWSGGAESGGGGGGGGADRGGSGS